MSGIFIPKHCQKFRLGQNGDPKCLCLRQLGTRRSTGHNVSRLFWRRSRWPCRHFFTIRASASLRESDSSVPVTTSVLPASLSPFGSPFHCMFKPASAKRCTRSVVPSFCKKFYYALCHHAAKSVDLADLLHGGFPEGLQCSKMLRQQSCCLVTDVADAKTEQKLIQIILLGAFDRAQKDFLRFSP